MDPYIQSLIDLVRIESVTDRVPDAECLYGEGVKQAVDQALALCESLGFRTRNDGYRTAWAEIGSGDPLTAILVHLDVVPVGSGWAHEQGEICDGNLYGRGVTDDKGPAVACIYAIEAACRAVFGTWGFFRTMYGKTAPSC